MDCPFRVLVTRWALEAAQEHRQIARRGPTDDERSGPSDTNVPLAIFVIPTER